MACAQQQEWHSGVSRHIRPPPSSTCSPFAPSCGREALGRLGDLRLALRARPITALLLEAQRPVMVEAPGLEPDARPSARSASVDGDAPEAATPDNPTAPAAAFAKQITLGRWVVEAPAA